MKKISVIGFGKIGQAVAANILKHGVKVNAVDIDESLSELFTTANFRSNEPGLEDILNNAFANKVLSVSSDFTTIKGSIAIIVAIPLLIDEEKHVLSAPFLDTMKKLEPGLADETVVV
ncbi:MAG TPA: 3-hydroxyacyl-CoA dehydrogenase NAD-binding domain-containing protein, partial [Chitinophagaceae bacterium]|nr:3-hydroxyacyl-CoA dehydrogenase NAD-binding domain-containing protein [Chitinophagaceae bacterium]